MTAVEELREAARLMRERAEKATPGPWVADVSEIYSQFQGGPWVGETCDPDDLERTDANATHIASWHPTVALGVADLLDALADFYDARDMGPMPTTALAVARAYLGGAR